jgi:hypothetical protein
MSSRARLKPVELEPATAHDADSSEAYWRAEGLERYFVDRPRPARTRAPGTKALVPLQPNIDDLVRLHRLVRQRLCQTVLEFGVGCSTVVLADALAKNEADYLAQPNRPRLRNRNAFRLFSVDAGKDWIEIARARLTDSLRPRVDFTFSRVVAGTFKGRLCHYYEKLPNVVADFIYLDGPAATDVEGDVNGLAFSADERTVVAADILLMESTLLPGTFILVDGRANNARFLERNFQRPFHRQYDSQGDVTSFELVEPPLGARRAGANSAWDRSFQALPAR